LDGEAMTSLSPFTKKAILQDARILEVLCNASVIDQLGRRAIRAMDVNRRQMIKLKRRLTIPNATWFQISLQVVPAATDELVKDVNDFLSNENGAAYLFVAFDVSFIVALVHSENSATAFAIRFSEHMMAA
jgi:hypothetical protein